MVTSGGYQKTTARIIADSVLNLREKSLIECVEAEAVPAPEGFSYVLFSVIVIL